MVGEVQAFGAFELALRHRLNGHGGAAHGALRNLVDRARKAGILNERASTVGIETMVLTPRLGDFNEDLRLHGFDALATHLRL
ncbi:hypothetical protein [Agrobacterium tumefaciens]|uniref:hypothetical protein n=1 Tax=Agrobacterium tumefaciens TaxID=358 RepID=UPI003C6C8AEE